MEINRCFSHNNNNFNRKEEEMGKEATASLPWRAMQICARAGSGGEVLLYALVVPYLSRDGNGGGCAVRGHSGLTLPADIIH